MSKSDQPAGVAVDRGVRPLVERLHELRLIYGDTEAGQAFADAEFELGRLEDLLFELGAMEDAPCFCCGYRGRGYYQPDTHPCAARHHRLWKAA
jgi:hypothetical protein